MASEWRVSTLGELTNWASGGTPPKDNPEYWGGDIPWISASSMKSGRLSESDRTLTQKGLEQRGRLARRNDVLLLVRGSELHKRIPIGVATRDVAFNQDVKSLRAKSDISSTYLYYWLAAHESMLLSKVEYTGIGAGKLDTAVLKALAVEVPAVEEQRAIAHILGTLDDKIELNRKQNETLEAMARALFKAWFVDFEPVRAKMEGRWQRGQSLPGLPANLYDLFPDRLVDSELGEIPEGWVIQRVRDIGQIICGKTPSTKVPEYYGDEIPFITIPEMHGNIFAVNVTKRLSHAGALSQQNKMLPQGAICVSCIATLGLVTITTEPSQTNQQINSVIPADKSATYYWYWILRNLSDEIKAGGSGGSVLGNLSTGRFAELKVLGSNADIRSAYHKMVESLFTKILENICESNSLAQLRDTLLPKLISGELRIADAEAFLKGHGV